MVEYTCQDLLVGAHFADEAGSPALAGTLHVHAPYRVQRCRQCWHSNTWEVHVPYNMYMGHRASTPYSVIGTRVRIMETEPISPLALSGVCVGAGNKLSILRMSRTSHSVFVSTYNLFSHDVRFGLTHFHFFGAPFFFPLFVFFLYIYVPRTE